MDGVFKSNLQELYRYMIQNSNALEVAENGIGNDFNGIDE